MIVNNQKYACNSCIKGHRVSACNHIQREVFPIAKKGRPVKQCEHCRSARKDKSHHAKCDCGSKKHKDATSIKTEQNSEQRQALWRRNSASNLLFL
ncbi:copper-fist-domain-containing protein [Tothia fuscella]|uniref:Copper-fist-domain-containing protein n=1 Tax=Tothia fuscella TaxID=1048955 RepID=A0A9P4NQ26_9PEZI|nr:copper-fist-domain-containing protein [Tothia fuscella]